MIALPIFLQMVLEYNAMEAGLSLAPLSLSMFVVGAARRPQGRPPPPGHHPGRLRLLVVGVLDAPADRAPRGLGLGLAIPLLIAGSGLGLLVSQLNNYTLSPITEEQVSEAAGVNSAAARSGSRSAWPSPARSCWRRCRSCSPTWPRTATVLGRHQQQVADVLEDDAEVMSNAQLEDLLADEPEEIQDEIIRINTDARPARLQVALLVPMAAGLLGLFNAFRKSASPTLSHGAAEGMLFD